MLPVKDTATARGWQAVVLVSVIALPAVLCLLFILCFGVDVPWSDEWAFVHLLGKMHSNSLSVADLFAQYHEHRLIFPEIVMLALASITGYNVVAEMLVSLALAVATGYVLWLMYRERFGTSTSSLLWFIPIPWMVFSFRQYENFLWGWQITMFMCVLGFVSSIYFLGKAEKPVNLIIALLCGIVSTFSFFTGLLVWPTGLVVTLLSGGKARTSVAATWLVAGLFSAAVYFFGWQRQPFLPPILFGLEHPTDAAGYFLSAIGSPFMYFDVSLVAGIVLMPLLLVILKFAWDEKAFSRNAPWIALILFSLCSTLILTVSRSGYGIWQANTSRYVTLTYPGFVGLYALALGMKALHPLVLKFLLIAIVIGLMIGYGGGVLMGEATMLQRQVIRDYLVHYSSVPDAQLAVLNANENYNASRVREGAQILEHLNYSVFRD